MIKKLIDSINDNFVEFTNKKVSKKEIEKKILPIFFFLNNSKNNMFLISGSQGIGKTTILKILNKNFYKFFGKRLLTLSLDDFYYDKSQRRLLSKSVHPLMITRGVPGTHNIKEIFNIIEKFNKSQYPIKIPIFNKLTDSQIKKRKIIKKKSDILILEGWCCGSSALKKEYLHKNINALEKKFDKKYIWRNYYNEKLKKEYSELFKKFDELIFFRPPSFSCVLKWRYNQENYLKNLNKNKSIQGMSKKNIIYFIQHYEKITKWMIKIMPKKANLTIFVDKNQKIKNIKKN